MFELHPRLQEDGLMLGRFPLSRLLLMNDSHYPWLVLVPERPGTTEIYQLGEEDQRQLLRESSTLAQALSTVFQADKINIAAIGNLVPQLHLHHVARYKDDIAWPKPIWGYADAVPYDEAGLAMVKSLIEPALGETYMALP